MTLESDIQREIMLRIGCRRDLLIMRRNVGFARDPNTGRAIKFGTKGEADLQGVLSIAPKCCACGHRRSPIGLAVALEVKTEHGRQTQEQCDWQAAWELRGGLYRVVRSADEAEQAIEWATP